MVSPCSSPISFSPAAPVAMPPGANRSSLMVFRARAGARCFAWWRGGCFFFVVFMAVIVLFFGRPCSSTALNKVARPHEPTFNSL